MNCPDIEQAFQILKQYPIPKQVLDHSIQVKEMSKLIGEQINSNGHKLDLKVLAVAGLLHDIGRHKYNQENGYSPSQDFHEYETGQLLTQLGYPELGRMAQCHPLGGLTTKETQCLGYPQAIDLMPWCLESKIVCIADKIRPEIKIVTLSEKIRDYYQNVRLKERYFQKMPGLLELTIQRVTAIWTELEKLGMETAEFKRLYRQT